jgi:hypothetical protein
MPISDFKTLANNPNRHTEIGINTLQSSMRMNGFVAPMTSSADGVILDGNARLEVASDVLQTEPIVIDSDGTRPIIVRRTDIPNADTILAKRIILSSNRVQELDYQPDNAILAEMIAALNTDGNLTGSGYTANDLESVIASAGQEAEETNHNLCPNCGYDLDKGR